MNNKNELDFLLNLLFEVGNSRKEHPEGHVRAKAHYAEAILIKTFLHISAVNSMLEKLNVVKANGKRIPFVDHSSIAVMVRAGLESYLTFSHIYSNPDPNITDFRYHCWDLQGYIERSKYASNDGEFQDLIQKENQLRLEKIELLESLDIYNGLSPSKKNRIKQGKWKLDYTWADLAENSGFDRLFFKANYSYLCEYAHTGRVSAMQIFGALKAKKNDVLINPMILTCLTVLAKLIMEYVLINEPSMETFNSNPNNIIVCNKWKDFGENLTLDSN